MNENKLCANCLSDTKSKLRVQPNLCDQRISVDLSGVITKAICDVADMQLDMCKSLH